MLADRNPLVVHERNQRLKHLSLCAILVCQRAKNNARLFLFKGKWLLLGALLLSELIYRSMTDRSSSPATSIEGASSPADLCASTTRFAAAVLIFASGG